MMHATLHCMNKTDDMADVILLSIGNPDTDIKKN